MRVGVRLIRPADRIPGQPTSGMAREQAGFSDRAWSGFVTTEPGTVSGWHHHGGFESVIYVLSGTFLMEFGPGGAQTLEAGAGDFLFIDPGAIHREGNPGSELLQAVVFRAGKGEAVFNVDGPEPSA
jgi:uncharacterized RmlC-like cupin family protein